MSINCPNCGAIVIEDHVMNVQAKILTALRTSKRPLASGQLAQLVYGENTRRNRNRLIVNIWHMNRPVRRISSGARGSASSGYSIDG